MARIECPATVATGTNGEALCLDGSSAPVAWVVVPDFDVADLDPVILGEAFAAGWLLVATGWAIGHGVKIVLSMLK